MTDYCTVMADLEKQLRIAKRELEISRENAAEWRESALKWRASLRLADEEIDMNMDTLDRHLTFIARLRRIAAYRRRRLKELEGTIHMANEYFPEGTPEHKAYMMGLEDGS